GHARRHPVAEALPEHVRAKEDVARSQTRASAVVLSHRTEIRSMSATFESSKLSLSPRDDDDLDDDVKKDDADDDDADDDLDDDVDFDDDEDDLDDDDDDLDDDEDDEDDDDLDEVDDDLVDLDDEYDTGEEDDDRPA